MVLLLRPTNAHDSASYTSSRHIGYPNEQCAVMFNEAHSVQAHIAVICCDIEESQDMLFQFKARRLDPY